MADAAHFILTKPSAKATGNCYIDEELLDSEDLHDFTVYQQFDGKAPQFDFWVGDPPREEGSTQAPT
jgi:citronellol/citronellal dehydrogenase